MTVVVDASLAIKWVVEEEQSEAAVSLRSLWHRSAELLVAPAIFGPEVTNVLHQRVRRGELGPTDASDALSYLLSSVAMREPVGLYSRALNLARDFALGSTYDALYLALAEAEGCEMWTADQRLVRAVRPRFPQVRCLAEVP